MEDYSQSFYWETLPLRGARCRLDGVYQRVLAHFDGPVSVAKLLGEVLVGLALLATTQKHFETLILQVQSEGDLRLLVAEIQRSGGMRAWARWQGEAEVDLATTPQGLLALTVDMGMDRDRYQGLIQLRDSLSASLAAYFDESVQSPAYFRLVVDPVEQIAGGYFLQRLPGVLGDPDWELAMQFLAVGSDRSLLLADPAQFLPEIFPEQGVRLRQPEPLCFSCTCSQERVERMLLSLGAEEVEETLAQEGAIRVTCEYCQTEYCLSAADVALLFAPDDAQRH